MPPRQRSRRKKLDETKFLFVNEDANTVTRADKDPELDRLKQSHVQRRNFAHRQKQKSHDGDFTVHVARHNDRIQAQYHTPSSSPPAFREQALNAKATESRPRQIDIDQTSTDQPQLGANTILGPVSDSGVHNSLHPQLTYPATSPAPAISLQTYTANNAQIALSNPLRSFTLHPILSDRFELLQRWAPPLMRYWTTVLLPEKFYADSRCVPLRDMRHITYVHDDMRLIMDNPAHMYAFLTNISTQMLGKEGRLLLPTANAASTPVDRTSDRLPEIFQSHAIHAVRQELSKNTLTHAIVNDVHWLMSAAYHACQFDAALPHYRAMLRMITTLGGLNTFNPYFIESMFLMHWSASLKRLARPTLPVASFDPGQGPPEIRTLVAQIRHATDDERVGAIMPTGTLQNLESASLLSSTLLFHAQHLIDVIQFARWAENQQVYNAMHFKWIDTRHVALGYHLLSTEPDIIYGKMNEAIRIALIWTVALTRSPESGQRCASNNVGRMKKLLESSSDGGHLLKNLWGNVPHGTETLLWVTVLGGLVAGKKNVAAREWFRGVARDCAVLLDLSGGYNVVELQQRQRQQYSFQELLMNGIDEGDDFEIGNLDLGHITQAAGADADAELAPELFINSITTTSRYHQSAAAAAMATATATATATEATIYDRTHDVQTGLEFDENDAMFDPAAAAAADDDLLLGTTAVTTSRTSQNHGIQHQQQRRRHQQHRQSKEQWELVQDIMIGFVWDVALQGEKLRVFWAEDGRGL